MSESALSIVLLWTLTSIHKFHLSVGDQSGDSTGKALSPGLSLIVHVVEGGLCKLSS